MSNSGNRTGRPPGPLVTGLTLGKVMFVVDDPGAKDALYRARVYGTKQGKRTVMQAKSYNGERGTMIWWVDKEP